MSRPTKDLDDSELSNLIENHRRQGATGLDIYSEAIAEQGKRQGKGLDFETTISVITKAARDGRFLSYGEVARASGADWNKVRHAIGPHLDRLIEFCHLNNIPLLSSIVVNQPNVESGKLEPDSLKGFIAGVRGAGIPVTDEESFLKCAQESVFTWAEARKEADN